MSSIDPNIPKLLLEGDSLETLVSISYDKIRAASNNTITDFREGSPVAALVEGQVFALSELLYYVNLLPEATALELFRLYGAQRSMGTKAKGRLTFQLAAISNQAFSLPVGYSFGYKGANLLLTEALLIPPGSDRGQAAVEVDTVGAAYNAGSYGVLETSFGLFNLQAAYNEEPLVGGSDIEPISQSIARMQTQLNTRQTLINQSDYELAAQDFLGVGSRAVCVPRLGADKATLAYGNVALFLLNGNGLPANTLQRSQLSLALAERAVIGTRVSCFPMELYDLSVEVFVQVATIDERVAQEIYDRLSSYLDPNSYDGGYKIRYNELAYAARNVPGCLSVESVLVNGNAIDHLLPNSYTLPNLTLVIVNQVSKDGRALETLFTPEENRTQIEEPE